MLVALLSYGIFSFLFGGIANLFGFLILFPLRILARLGERMIETPRTGDWARRGVDQALLDFATRNAVSQASRYGAYPTAASAAVRFTRMIGFR